MEKAPSGLPHFSTFHEKTLNDLVDIRTARWPDLVAMTHYDHGRWKDTTWAELGELIHYFALGLRSLGVTKGTAVAILSETCRNWTVTDLAIIASGGVTVGVYTTLTAEQSQYIIDHSEASVVVVQNKTLLDKLLQVREQLPKVHTFIIMQPEGVTLDGKEFVSWDQVVRIGKDRGPAARQKLCDEHKEEDPQRVVTYVYTSGTTGPPKGAMLTHSNFLFAMQFYGKVLPVSMGEVGMSFLPLAHALQRVIDYLVLYVGARVYYARSLSTVREDILQARPTAMGSVPRIFEKIYAGVQKQAADKGPVAQRLFTWAVGVGREMSKCWQASRRPSPSLTLRYKLAYLLVLRKIKNALGGRIRIIGSGGAPISTEIQEFFHACGILILEAWGLTETTAMGTLTRPEAYKFGTVGLPAEGVDIKIDQDGEILIKGPCVFAGYYKDPEKTREAFDGPWFRTGDVGQFDQDGFLRITDRKKDLIITGYGKNIAPQNIENALKGSRYISQALAYGDRQKYLVALVTLDKEEITQWATQQGIACQDVSELASHPNVQELIQAEISEINKQLASFENIRKFHILPRDFTIEDGELTPTLKVKRKTVNSRYLDAIKKLYGDDWMN